MSSVASHTRTYRLARHLSVAGHPFIVIPASVAAVSVLRGGGSSSGASIAIVFVAAAAAVLIGVRTGHFNDFDVSERQRRPAFYLIVTAATAALAFRVREQPDALWACCTAAALLITSGLLNRWIKASLHTSFSLYAAGLWGVWSLPAGLIALPIAASIAWSRVHLGRHSRAEVLAGAALGLVAGASLVLRALL